MHKNLYMILELEKIRQNHVEGIWVKPYASLTFQVYIMREKFIYELFLVKNNIEDTWLCKKDLNSKKVLEFTHVEALDMINEINNLDLKFYNLKSSIFKFNNNIEDKFKELFTSKNLDKKSNNSFFLIENYKKKSELIIQDICNDVTNVH